ncbi:MAG: TIGR01212 family radical SAM protein [Treponema sp.]|nr:TIGR01212 family radical SAM protein [Treponema sp.]
MTYYSLSDYLKKTFGTKVYKISLSTGCTCPTRDGTKGFGGCTFCSAGGSGDFAAAPEDISIQIQKAKLRVDAKFPKKTPVQERKYIAYFQSFTNTYAPVNVLKPMFMKAILQPEIAALSIGTRPDCLPDEMIDMLSELNKIKPVWIELGLQTVHEDTARSIRRGYELSAFESAYSKLKTQGLTVIVHVILGLPGETHDDMLETVRYLSRLVPVLDGIKLQMLHILEGTALGEEYKLHPFHVFSLEEYCSLIADCLKLIPAQTVVHRLTGDGPKRLLIAPLWSGNKKLVLNTLHSYLRQV